MNFLSPQELLAVLRIARDHSLRDLAIIVTQFSHGLRPSEVCNIKMDDIKDGQLTVQRLKGSKITCQPIRRHRGEPLLDEGRILSSWIAARPHDSGTALFTSRRGGAITAKHYHRLFQRYARLAGLPESKQHPHCIRHTTATTLVRQGLDIAWVAGHLGHRSISSTAIYTHLADSEISERANDAFIDAFKEKTV